ncbi:MAG: DUF3048 domain-containing protein [Clostridiales bacterium]|nr:DUF3048 domain-containing protein [Clostridiales bacterium]
MIQCRQGSGNKVHAVLWAILLALLLLSAGCGKDSGGGASASVSQEKVELVAQAIGKGHRTPIVPEKAIPEPEPELPTGVLVMIDNYAPARPQMGLDKADVVFEIIAEGGITRYMALFYSESAPVIGPVRSARYYFVQLARGMDLPYAHVGGAEDALALIGSLRIKDINEISNASRYFWQDPKRNRPHSTYTSTDNLIEAIANKQYAYKAPDLPAIGKEFAGTPLAEGQLNLAYVPGRNGYQVQWVWDGELGEGGCYRRYINGQAQSTADGVPMTADTIYVIAAQSKPRNTDPVTSSVEIVGGGDALRIVDNKITRGTWKKESAERPLLISDAAGWPMDRKSGRTWIQVVDKLEDVSFGK